MAEHWRLTGKRALVTGGTQGIGLAISQELLALGAEVIIVARNASTITRCTSAWRDEGYGASGMAADITLAAQRETLFREIEERFGGIDILINNVGTNIRKKIHEYALEEYQTVMQTNMHATFEMCRLAFPLLVRSTDAAVVNIISVAGMTHLRTGAPYGMSKAATLQLTKNLAVEWASQGIRVNAVAPWYTRTPLVENLLQDEAYLNEILARTPMGRIAAPEEVAAVAVFFCLPAASYVTGQCLAVDGGFTVNGF